MSNPAHVDSDPMHLWPRMRLSLQAAFDACAGRGLHMQLFEGYRSKERQAWLYAQGRTRPGEIVTYLKTPLRHGAGIAADCYPTKRGEIVFAFTPAELNLWRGAMKAHSLEPTRMKGDFGHAQLVVGAAEMKAAKKWCDAGFPAGGGDMGDLKRIRVFINNFEQTDRVKSWLEGGNSIGDYTDLWDYFGGPKP